MKYEKCLTCKQLGNECDGPNFIAMDTVELGQWCDEKRKTIPGLTYDKMQTVTGISKTAIYNFLKGVHPDCRLETIRPIIKELTGGKWDDNPCGNVSNTEKAAYEDRIKELEKLLDYEVRWRDDKIQHLQKTNASLETLVVNNNARATTDKDFLRSEMKRKNKTIVILSTCLGICLLVIIGALVIDRINPEIGFFWLRSWLGGSGWLQSMKG